MKTLYRFIFMRSELYLYSLFFIFSKYDNRSIFNVYEMRLGWMTIKSGLCVIHTHSVGRCVSRMERFERKKNSIRYTMIHFFVYLFVGCVYVVLCVRFKRRWRTDYRQSHAMFVVVQYIRLRNRYHKHHKNWTLCLIRERTNRKTHVHGQWAAHMGFDLFYCDYCISVWNKSKETNCRLYMTFCP